MRLPRLEDGSIDVPQVSQMVDEFLAAGGTYFDTAWAYGGSEEAIRQALVERYPRDGYTLATKNAAWLGPKDADEAKAQLDVSLERSGAGALIIEPDRAAEMMQENSVLVVVDTQRASNTVAPQLLTMALLRPCDHVRAACGY